MPGDFPAKIRPQPTFEVAVLRELAVDSGGRSIIVDIPDLTTDFTVVRMISFVQDIAAELRGQYTLKYHSTTQVQTPKRRSAFVPFRRTIRCDSAGTVRPGKACRECKAGKSEKSDPKK